MARRLSLRLTFHTAHQWRGGEVNGTPARQWAYVREYGSEQERRAALIDFVNVYNDERPQSALSHTPPATRVPLPSYRLTTEGIVVPTIPERPQQLSFDDLTA
jgi:hypothetical protein